MSGATGSNLERLKAAYAAWDACKAGDCSMWHALVHDDVRLNSLGADAPGLEFTKQTRGRDGLTAYLDALRSAWTLLYFDTRAFIVEGDNIAVFGVTSWTNNATGKTATVPIAHLWTFRNGKVSDWTEIFDGTPVTAAIAA